MQPVERQSPEELSTPPPRQSWSHKLAKLLFIMVCFEVGVFLVVFPWLESWDHNSIANMTPWMRDLWDNSYVRGALSGLGLVNIYISLGEIFGLRRPRAVKMKAPLL